MCICKLKLEHGDVKDVNQLSHKILATLIVAVHSIVKSNTGLLWSLPLPNASGILFLILSMVNHSPVSLHCRWEETVDALKTDDAFDDDSKTMRATHSIER